MQENKYDDSFFYAKYSQMPRSVEGLAAAGEWHALQKLLPSFQGKRVLDLGCGFGWHCRYAADHGAAQVTGVDLSANMLAEAAKKNAHPNIRYEQAAIEDFPAGTERYDIVISSLALHYLDSFGDICLKVYAALSPGGHFVFSVEHPIFTAQGPQEWHCGDEGKRLFWPVDDYFREGEREALFLGERVRKNHKTLTTYMSGLLGAGFRITGVVEPAPDARLLGLPGMIDELRRPMMLLVAAEAPAAD